MRRSQETALTNARCSAAARTSASAARCPTVNAARAHSHQVIIKQGVGIRGDLAAVAVGSHSTLCENVVITPPEKQLKKYAFIVACSNRGARGVAYFPVTIGDYVHVEAGAQLHAASIGSMTRIGRRAVLARLLVCSATNSDGRGRDVWSRSAWKWRMTPR